MARFTADGPLVTSVIAPDGKTIIDGIGRGNMRPEFSEPLCIKRAAGRGEAMIRAFLSFVEEDPLG